VVLGDADGLGPDVVGFIVVLIDGDVQLIGGGLPLFCQGIPSPGEDFLL